MKTNNKAPYVTKGTKVRFDFFKKTPGFVSLAGMQDKFEVRQMSGEGIVRNVWADDPHGNVNLRFNVELADGTFLEVPAKGVIGVFENQKYFQVVF
jgi:hypothetical protein